MKPLYRNLLSGLAMVVPWSISAYLWFNAPAFKTDETLIRNPNTIEIKVLPFEAISTVEIPEISNQKIPDYTQMTWQQAVEYVKTPGQAQEYIKQVLKAYDNNDGYISSFAINHNTKKANCVGRTFAAAALLSDNGYKASMLIFAPEQKSKAPGDGHGLFLFKTTTGFGAIGTEFLEPKYETVDELVNAINAGYEAQNINFRYYQVVDLDATYPSQQWINGKEPLPCGVNSLNVLTKYKEIKQ